MKGYGLVLGGGGSKGSYEVGVWKALRELDIPIIAVAGTSVGALNGAMVVQGDYNKAYDLWAGITFDKVFKIDKDIPLPDSGDKFDEIAALIKIAIHNKGLDITPLRKLLIENIDEEKIRESEIEFGFVTISITDKKPIIVFKENVPKGRMVDYLLASAALPVFQPLTIDGVRFLDGAFYDNLPISILIEKLFYNIISVDVSGLGRVKRIKEKDLNIIQIKNSEDLGYDLDFNPEFIKRNIELGYYDTMKAFNRYKGKNYYLSNTKFDLEFDLAQIKLIYDYLGIDRAKKTNPQNKYIIYKLIRTIKKHSASRNIKKYSDIIISAAEITAEIMEIDRLRDYTLEELIGIIIESYKSKKNEAEFLDFTAYVYENIIAVDAGSINEKIKKAVFESKFAAIYNIDIKDLTERTILFRRFLALTFPKLCIANIFLALVNLQYDFDS